MNATYTKEYRPKFLLKVKHLRLLKVPGIIREKGLKLAPAHMPKSYSEFYLPLTRDD